MFCSYTQENESSTTLWALPRMRPLVPPARSLYKDTHETSELPSSMRDIFVSVSVCLPLLPAAITLYGFPIIFKIQWE